MDSYSLGEMSAKELGLELGHQGDNPLTIMILYSYNFMEALSLQLLHGWTLRVVILCMFVRVLVTCLISNVVTNPCSRPKPTESGGHVI